MISLLRNKLSRIIWMELLPWRSPPLVLRLVIVACLAFVYPYSFSVATDSLAAGDSLIGNQTLVSTGGIFELGFFSPTSSISNSSSSNYYLGIWHYGIPDRKVVWVANRRAPVVGSPTTPSLILTTAGYLVIGNSSAGNPPLWSAGVGNHTNPRARLKDDGNFVIIETGGNGMTIYTAWQSFEHPSDTLLPGMKMGINRRTGTNYSLVSWSGPGDPTPGDYMMTFDNRGSPEISFYSRRSGLRWRSGPWMPSVWKFYRQLFEVSLVDMTDEVFYSYQMSDKYSRTPITYVVNYSSGTIERWVWAPSGGGGWTMFEVRPSDQCDYYGRCGNHGICEVVQISQQGLCRCMPGFEPSNPGDWERRDWAGGCVPIRATDCSSAGTTDGFVKLVMMKFPDTTATVTEKGWGKPQCRGACRSNCSCKAYAVYDGDGNGSGWCMMWFGELLDVRTSIKGPDLFVRVALADAENEFTHKKKLVPVLGIIVGCIVFVLLLSAGSYLTWRRTRGGRLHRTIAKTNEVVNSELPTFDLATILALCDNFSRNNILGEGGYGPVYKGILSDGQEVAIKRLSNYSLQGREEFKNEVLSIGKLQHKNLVRLLGYCINGNERILIYEYMARKSLDHYLFGYSGATPLDWETRYRIILGTARGLLYLHHDSRLKIIHRDLKAANILLDEDMEPKISDFGMARVFEKDQTNSKTKRVVGTYGYMSPEYALDGIFSMKSDIFSFGVLVLEIVSGLKNRAMFRSNPEENLLGQAWILWKEGKGLDLLDPIIDLPLNTFEVLNTIKVGLLCVQELPEDRPTMSSLIQMLGNLNMGSLPEPRQPGYVAMDDRLKLDLLLENKLSDPMYEMTTSIYEGR